MPKIFRPETINLLKEGAKAVLTDGKESLQEKALSVLRKDKMFSFDNVVDNAEKVLRGRWYSENRSGKYYPNVFFAIFAKPYSGSKYNEERESAVMFSALFGAAVSGLYGGYKLFEDVNLTNKKNEISGIQNVVSNTAATFLGAAAGSITGGALSYVSTEVVITSATVMRYAPKAALGAVAGPILAYKALEAVCDYNNPQVGSHVAKVSASREAGQQAVPVRS